MPEIDLHVSGGDTLTFSTEKLVARLNERLAANEAERQAKKEKAAARNKEAHDRIVAALDNPQFLIFLMGQLRSYSRDYDAASDAFASHVAETWPEGDGDDLSEEYDPDYHLRRLIDTYELAEDTEVKLTITDEAYQYLARPKGAGTDGTPTTE